MTGIKPTGRAVSMPRGLVTGALLALAMTLAGCALTAKLVDLEILEFDAVGYAAMGILLASAWAGAATACGKIRRRLLMVSLLSGLCYFCLLLMLTALFFAGQYQGAGETALLVMGGSLLAFLAKPAVKKTGTVRKRKMRNR